jgi:hypothetical protein
MVEQATVGYTYSEAPSASYGYTYKEPTAIHEVPHHKILHKLRVELPELAHRVPQVAYAVRGAEQKYAPAAQRAFLGIAHAFLSGEEGLLKMRLERIKLKEAQGQKLTPEEMAMKERAEKMLQRMQYLKKGVDEKRERLEKEHQMAKLSDMEKLEDVV